MKKFIEPIKEWFGYSRVERRSSFILLLIILFVIVSRYFFPGSKSTAEDVTSAVISRSEEITDYSERDEKRDPLSDYFSFDPNSATQEALIRLGLSDREAATLIRYREKGGKFRTKTDLRKVYGLDTVKADKLMPYVSIKQDTFRSRAITDRRKPKPVLELNRCDSVSLVSLPGIGPVLAGRIIKYRHRLGGFARAGQLKEVYGLPEETFKLIESRVTADSAYIVRIDINSAGYREFLHVPYLEKYEITAILKYKELKGKISGINELVENKLITYEKSLRIAPYLKF